MLPLTLSATAFASPPAAAAAAANPPNILFLMCDSMDGRVVDPTSPVSKRVATPTLDHLAATGVNFVRTYAASPQCVPSRTTMLAGRRTDQIRAFSNGNALAGDPSSTGGLDADCVKYYDEQTCSQWATSQNVSSTFFDALAPVYAAGNAVESDECTLCIMGKVDVGQNILTRYGPSATADGWHNGPTLSILTRAADIRKPTKPDPRTITNDNDNNVHQEDWKMHTQCIEWLEAEGAARRRRSRSSSSSSSPPPLLSPWFLYCSLNIPHPPFNTNATWIASVDEAAVRAAKPVWPANVSTYHPHDAYMSLSKAVGGSFSDDDIYKTRMTYYAMCAETDYLMGQVVAAAKASGMYDDTLVVFVSDHGEMNMEHRQVWKNAHYEASARVPFIVSGGAVAGASLPRGRVVTNLTSLLDVYPTLLSMAQLPQPPADFLAGASLSPFLKLADAATIAPRKEYVASQYHSNMGNTGAFMLRRGAHKYVAFGHGFNGTFGGYAPQLFDVAADPDELHDLASSQPQLAAELDATLRAELASGDNALSETGDYREIDVFVKQQQQHLYQRFFADGGANLAREFGRLVECEADRARQSVADFLRADPELERPCANSLSQPGGAEALAEVRRMASSADPSQQLRKLLEKTYTGFDDADWAQVQAWAKADPSA